VDDADLLTVLFHFGSGCWLGAFGALSVKHNHPSPLTFGQRAAGEQDDLRLAGDALHQF
jgi:hypothetical protein